MTPDEHDEYMRTDAWDRENALQSAIQALSAGRALTPGQAFEGVLFIAEAYYKWLRKRPSLEVTISIEAGSPAQAKS